MLVKFTDYNNAENVIASTHQEDWNNVYKRLSEMPSHLKLSDQAGNVGNYIFNPVGTNNYIKNELKSLGWIPNIPIPKAFNFLGIDIDFGKKGVVFEVQFSNYPFLLNNVVRSELFYKSKALFMDHPTDLLIIVTKTHMFPASNSTLYYEQAVNQLGSLIKYDVFDIPIRLVGLFEKENEKIAVKLTQYQNNRYSRLVTEKKK